MILERPEALAHQKPILDNKEQVSPKQTLSSNSQDLGVVKIQNEHAKLMQTDQ